MRKTSNTLISYYFNLLLAKANAEAAQQNLGNTQKLYKIAEARFKIGQMSESELLQLKVTLLNAESELVNAKSALDARMFELRSFLGYDENTILRFPSFNEFTTEQIPVLTYPEVLDWANRSNSFTQNIQRRMLEAERDVSKAKAGRWNISLFASIGRVGQDDTRSKMR